LYRYFSVTDARFGVLTNGIDYRIFSDLEQPNKMDTRPFLEFRTIAISDAIAAELKKFTKETFDIENILATASELKYTKGIKRLLAEEWVNPSDDFVKIMAGRVYAGRMTQSVRDQFGQITKHAFQEFVNDRVNERLKSALEGERSAEFTQELEADDDASPENERQIVTTDEEIDGYYVVKSIVREVLSAERVFMRDTQTYCGVLVDDNNRKPICRLWFNSPKKYLGTFDDQKKETRRPIENVNGIYDFADTLKATAMRYTAVDVDDEATIDSN
jgi:hypothetical protein